MIGEEEKKNRKRDAEDAAVYENQPGEENEAKQRKQRVDVDDEVVRFYFIEPISDIYHDMIWFETSCRLRQHRNTS